MSLHAGWGNSQSRKLIGFLEGNKKGVESTSTSHGLPDHFRGCSAEAATAKSRLVIGRVCTEPWENQEYLAMKGRRNEGYHK